MGPSFQPYPFEKLRELIADVTPNPDYEPAVLTVGEPKFDTPELITKTLGEEAWRLRFYPKTGGEAALDEALIGFVKRRFWVEVAADEIISTLGTREVLFTLPQYLLFAEENPKMAFTNPFYQIYEGAGLASRAEMVHLDLTPDNGFMPPMDEEALDGCGLVILNFPNNPTGAVMDLETMKQWVALALKYDFVLVNDECYSEIYVEEKPVSILEASVAAGNPSFKNVLALNSISKRSSAPGLRSGFLAGDKTIIQGYLQYRTYAGVAIPHPLQYAAAAAWSDDAHAETIRQAYVKNLALAREILGVETSGATFYLWLHVGDDLEAARELLQRYNILVLPGSFLSRGETGRGYVRIALVESPEKMKPALERLAVWLKERN